MKAAITPAYGDAEVIEFVEIDRPEIRPNQVLIEVRATTVTAGDRRLRAADFPSFTAILGRLMMGVTRPRHAVQGTMFAGRVVARGSEVTAWNVGDDVFGATEHGAYAEYLAMDADAPIARMPVNLDYEQASQLPYGAGTAYDFLIKRANLERGEHILVLGASGGVGRFAVQLAHSVGATVTAVASGSTESMVRDLGADSFIDYRTTDWRSPDVQYDVIFDVADVSTFREARPHLTDNGRYATVFASLRVLVAMGLSAVLGGPRALFGVAMPNRADMEHLRTLAERGDVKPVVGPRFSLDELRRAHAHAQRKSHHGVAVLMQHTG